MSVALVKAFIIRAVYKFVMIFVLVLCYSFQLVSAANSYRQIELKYRNAVSVQQSLLPFTDENTAIIAQGNSLILKGPTAEIKQLSVIVKKLDKPLKQLQVSIYRGIDPSTELPGEAQNSHQDQRWSTRTGKDNRVDIVSIEEGSTLLINEDQFIKVALETATELGQSEPDKQSSSQQANSLEFASSYQRNETLLLEKGVRLTANLVADKDGQPQVSLTAVYSLPESTQGRANNTNTVSIASNRQTSVVTRVKLGQWQLLSLNQQQSQQPGITNKSSTRKQVFSTPQKDDSDYKVWVKFKVL